MTDSAMVLRQMLPWQMNSTFICSFISSQILSKARKYWVCGVFRFFDTLSFLLKIEHIFSGDCLKNWLIFKNLRQQIQLSYFFTNPHKHWLYWTFHSKLTHEKCPFPSQNARSFKPLFSSVNRVFPSLQSHPLT